MSKEIYISSTPHETRLAIVENDALAEIYYERENEYTLAGSIYNGRVTRVLPGMQSSFVDIGLERDAFLYITDFMEEAGDTADFEASANPGDSGRARNVNHGNGDRHGRDRGAREPQPQLAEPSDADLFVQAVSGLDPSRPVIEGERPERSERDRGRRGGRNRGNRGGNREGRPDEARVPRSEFEKAPIPEVAAPLAGNISIPDSQDEVGEGLPGADGSRRWRGRRGRNRGNRGSRPEGVAPVATEAPATGPIYDAYASEPVEFEPGLHELEEPLLAAAETLPTESEQVAFRERSFPGDRGPRSDRGDRNDRGDRGRRDRGAAGAPRVPRGFAPSPSLYKVDKNEPRYGFEPEIEAPVEPVILPGESLSKYRAPSEASSEAATGSAPVAAGPAVSDFVAEGWDGGLVLPGETLRPRTGAPAPYRNDTPQESRGREGRGDRGRGDRERGRGDRFERGPREPRREFEQPIAEPAPVAEVPTYLVAEVPTYLTEPEHVPASHLVTPVTSTFVPPPPVPVVAHEVVDAPPMVEEPVAAVETVEPTVAAEPAVETLELLPAVEAPVTEYEPEEASASYRVDPVAPREFRQAAPAVEEQIVEEQIVEEQVVEEPLAAEPEVAEVAPEPEPEFLAAVEVPVELAQAQSAEAHEVTSISETGTMHSEPAAVSERELPAQEHAEPNSPIEHEAAVVNEIVSAPVPVAPFAAYFEPGSGFLEEELLDDDEDAGVVPAVQAHSAGYSAGQSAADFEQQEQVALENAADLGTMLREMSIDQLTRTEPALDEDEEDDFEEDFLEEDQDFDSEEDEDEEEEGGDEVAFGEIGNESELENGELGEPGGAFEDAEPLQVADEAEYAKPADREPRREGRGDRGRGRDARRDGRGDRGNRDRRPGSGDRDRSHGSGSSDRGRHEGRGRQSAQATNLPAISDLLKPGQEILVQIAKEPIAKKGARITSHIALPGRFLVFMPTVSHTGVSRKIESDAERRRLKEILLSERGEAQGGFIVRTAAAGASEEELRSDLRFLLNLWADIKTRSESSKSPALIYHDLNLIERVLRDQVTDNFSAIWVDSETEYERVLRFLQRFQPSLIRRVKLYTKETPMYEQFGITDEINKALRSKVWLKSGGSIVINQTEALVAIDINTGKYVGKTARLEDTIVKTNLDAIPEIVRQIRLRDLGGIIIIDFIDMDERKNRNKVMQALEDELKLDRAPSKVLQFNDFGLVAITRKRVKQSLERTLSTTCGVCAGTGMVKSPVTVCNDIYVEMKKMAKHLDRGDVMLRVNPEVVKQLKAPSTHWLQEMEEMCGKTILVKSDPSLHPEQFDIH
jgi:ribonuclease G